MENLEENNLLSGKYELVNYKKENVQGMQYNMYDIEIKETNSNTVKSITIIETYPDEYTMIFNF